MIRAPMIGPLRLTQALALQLGASATAAAVAGGLWLGVVTAADPVGTALPSGGIPPVGQPESNSGLGASGLPPTWPRKPLHALLQSRLLGEKAAPAQRQVVAGRLVRLGVDSAVVATGPGQTRTVVVSPQTRFPARRPRQGERLIIVGRPLPDGTFQATAVLRPPTRNAAGEPRAPGRQL